jgi:hypothetical protein
MLRPQQAQRPGDLIGMFGDEEIEFLRRDPAALADFLRVQVKRAGDRAEEKNLDEFATGFRRRAEFQQRTQREARVVPADFLAQFAPGRLGVIFACIEMAAAGGIPAAGKRVLDHAAALQKNAATRIVDQHVHGAMQEISRMDFATRRLTHGLIVEVDHIEKLVEVGLFANRFRLTHGAVPAWADAGSTTSIFTGAVPELFMSRVSAAASEDQEPGSSQKGRDR